MANMKLTVNVEMRRRAWIFWRLGPLLFVWCRVDYAFPDMQFPRCNWSPLGHLYAAGIGKWIWQRSNLGRISIDEVT